MPIWERNCYVMTGSVIIAGIYYFSMVLKQSLVLGQIAPPDLPVLISYVVLQICLSVGGIVGTSVWTRVRGTDAGLREDERDMLCRHRAEGWAGHVFAAAIGISLIGWFLHQNMNVMFHGLIAGLMLGEITRCMAQVFNYNRVV